MMNLVHLYHLAVAQCSGTVLGVGLYDGLCQNGQPNFTALNDIYILIGNVIRLALTFVGFLSVIFIIVGGIMYIVSTGDPGRIARARGIIEKAITGLIISLVAFGAVTYIAGLL